MPEEITTVQLTKKFVAWLDSKGKRNESYEEVLKRLLKCNSI